jgi:DNA processing protein
VTPRDDFRKHVRQLTLDDAPAFLGLHDLPDRPAAMFMAGEIPEPARCVAIVGTRQPCGLGRRFARELARELAAAGHTVVSGGAEGIDSEAHWGAIEGRGVTVAFLGTPVARPYPTKNIQLFQAIAQHGCVLSEIVDSNDVYRSSFLARNRLIAAMADVVVVVQAPFKSGALSTAAHAHKLGRPLLAVPHAPWDVRGGGCIRLLAEGAKICRSAADVLSLAAPKPGPAPGRSAGVAKKSKRYQGLEGQNPRLDGDELRLVKVLQRGPATVDELCERTELSAPRVQRAALMLMLSKVIQEIGGGRYARVDRA